MSGIRLVIGFYVFVSQSKYRFIEARCPADTVQFFEKRRRRKKNIYIYSQHGRSLPVTLRKSEFYLSYDLMDRVSGKADILANLI